MRNVKQERRFIATPWKERQNATLYELQDTWKWTPATSQGKHKGNQKNNKENHPFSK